MALAPYNNSQSRGVSRLMNNLKPQKRIIVRSLYRQSIKLALTCKGNYLKNYSMSKSDYVEKIAQDNRPRNLPKQAIKDMVNETFAFILRSLKEDHKFTYPGFGSFRLKNRKARKGTNPNTGEKITIASRKAISFTVSEKLKKKLR